MLLLEPMVLLFGTLAAMGSGGSADGGTGSGTGGPRAREVGMASVVEGNSQFAVDLYGKLKGQAGNLFFSPSSISIALAMTYAGARGETAKQMAEVLHFPGPQDQLPAAFAALETMLRPTAGKPGYRLDLANRLWGQQGYHFLPEFLAVTRDDFHAELAQVDFINETEQARATINRWVEQRTEDKIQDLVPAGAISALTRLVLTNAIYFKGAWSKPFPKTATRDEPFHVTSDKTTEVPLMQKTDQFRFAAVDGLKALELPYGNGDLAMLVLLPDAIDGLGDLEAKLSLDALNRWTSGMQRRPVQVYLPRFKMTSAFSLANVLAAMGMPLAFDDSRADFTGISTEEHLAISAVLHKAFVDVNEEGTEAAAATAVAIGVRAVLRPQPPVVFRADHPFLFAIADQRTKALLFVGRMVNPQG